MTEKILNRKSAIKALVTEGNVQSQEELMGLLEEKGYSVTQATLSRDLKELGVAKVYDKHLGYCYRLSSYVQNMPHSYKEATPFDGILTIEFCGNLLVVRTIPGFASVVASMIDNNVKNGVAGTIAGDDTVFVALRNPFSKEQVMETLENAIPGTKNKFKRETI